MYKFFNPATIGFSCTLSVVSLFLSLTFLSQKEKNKDLKIDNAAARSLPTPFLPSMSGKVLFVTDPNNCCSIYSPGTIPIPNVSVTIQNLTAGTTNVVTTDVNGQYSFTTTTGNLKITPSKTTEAVSGVTITTFDIVILRKHLLKIQRLMCPFMRIAGDVNGDGVLSESDNDMIRDYILGILPAFTVPKWRFVPRAYIKPGYLNKNSPAGMDNTPFSSNFWQNDWFPFPFNAKYKYNGTTTYNYGTGTTWMDKLNEWPLTTTNGTNDTLWGFYALRSGDVRKSNSDPIVFKGARLLFKGVKKMENDKNYSVVIRGISSQKILGYQLALNINPDYIKSNSCTPSNAVGQNDRNFNKNDLQSKGLLKTLWTNPDNRDNFNRNMEIATIKIKTNKLDLLDDPAALIGLDEAALTPEFVGPDGEVLDWQIEIEVIED